MVRKKLKSYAEKKGFTISGGFAYGEYRGYLITLSEDAGVIRINIAAELSDELYKAELDLFLYENNIKQKYTLAEYHVTEDIIFANMAYTKDALTVLDKFLDYMCSTLEYMKISGDVFCASCGYAVTGKINSVIPANGIVKPLHSSCAEKMTREIIDTRKEKKSSGSILTGSIGAVLGGLVGSIPWAVAYYFGWFVAWLGLLIGLAAKKGYELFRGKESKIKALVIILVTVITVVVAEFVALGISVYVDYQDVSYVDVSLIGAFRMLLYFLPESRAAFRDFASDVIMGWVFAGLGVAGSIKEIFSETDANININMPVVLK